MAVLRFDSAGQYVGLDGYYEKNNAPTTQPAFYTVSDQFRFPNEGQYVIYPNIPSFVGVWDLSGATLRAVPEPATWTVMLLGLGLVGTALRRKARPAAL